MSDSLTGTIEQGPLHGYRGEPASASAARWPSGLTIAISREAGARGGSIAQRVSRKLGWQVVDQELLDYLVQDELAFQDLPEPAREWADERLDQLLRARVINHDPEVISLARVVLRLGVQGEVVLIGRAGGHLLPPPTTLHVRVVAPESDRVAYMAQSLRLTAEEAAEEVGRRDRRRSEFLAQYLGCQPSDPYHYDLLLNSSRLGEEQCADLSAQAARGKLLGLEPAADASPPMPDAGQ
jgi:cytidylate kinase